MTHISVSIDDEHLNAMAGVVRALQAKGMHVEQVLDGVGIVTGSATTDCRLLLESVPGVACITDGQLTYQLPPPDADLQ